MGVLRRKKQQLQVNFTLKWRLFYRKWWFFDRKWRFLYWKMMILLLKNDLWHCRKRPWRRALFIIHSFMCSFICLIWWFYNINDGFILMIWWFYNKKRLDAAAALKGLDLANGGTLPINKQQGQAARMKVDDEDKRSRTERARWELFL